MYVTLYLCQCICPTLVERFRDGGGIERETTFDHGLQVKTSARNSDYPIKLIIYNIIN
jgi:hypothetical protein